MANYHPCDSKKHIKFDIRPQWVEEGLPQSGQGSSNHGLLVSNCGAWYTKELFKKLQRPCGEEWQGSDKKDYRLCTCDACNGTPQLFRWFCPLCSATFTMGGRYDHNTQYANRAEHVAHPFILAKKAMEAMNESRMEQEYRNLEQILMQPLPARGVSIDMNEDGETLIDKIRAAVINTNSLQADTVNSRVFTQVCDTNSKENISYADTQDCINGVRDSELYYWNYISMEKKIEMLGPLAQQLQNSDTTKLLVDQKEDGTLVVLQNNALWMGIGAIKYLDNVVTTSKQQTYTKFSACSFGLIIGAAIYFGGFVAHYFEYKALHMLAPALHMPQLFWFNFIGPKQVDQDEIVPGWISSIWFLTQVIRLFFLDFGDNVIVAKMNKIWVGYLFAFVPTANIQSLVLARQQYIILALTITFVLSQIYETLTSNISPLLVWYDVVEHLFVIFFISKLIYCSILKQEPNDPSALLTLKRYLCGNIGLSLWGYCYLMYLAFEYSPAVFYCILAPSGIVFFILFYLFLTYVKKNLLY